MNVVMCHRNVLSSLVASGMMDILPKTIYLQSPVVVNNVIRPSAAIPKVLVQAILADAAQQQLLQGPIAVGESLAQAQAAPTRSAARFPAHATPSPATATT
jgi:hypothetical protein